MGWLSGWQYRKSHEIQGSSGGDQTNYQIKIIVHKGAGTDSGEHVYCNNDCRNDFGDIRFTKSDGVTELDYWMEEYTSGDQATFWVEVDSIPASPDKATIYIYYGNPSATTTSNGDDTFLFFDDWEDGQDHVGTKWEVIGFRQPLGGSHAVIDDYGKKVLKIYLDAAETDRTFRTLSTIDDNVAIHVRGKMVQGGTANYIINYAYTHFQDSNYQFAFYEEWRVVKYTGSFNKLGYYDELWADASGFYREVEVRKHGTNVEFLLDGERKISSSSGLSGASKLGFGPVRFSGSTTDVEVYFDYFFVRKYADPEPTHGSWGNEEQSGATEVAITDSATGIEALSRPYRGLTLTDIATSQESFSRPYRQLQIPEQASSLELLLKTRNLNLGDIAASLETIERARQIGAITDTAQSLEQILKQRFISLLDAAAGGETIARPTRMIILADEALSQEILSKLRELTAVTDSAIGIEYVNVGAEGAIKTRIFLLIGDLAIQITGD